LVKESKKVEGIPYATGKLGGEFSLLRAYIDEAGAKDIVPDRDVFDLIRHLASQGATADRAIKVVAEELMKKIEPSAALRAYKRVYGLDTSEEEAVRAVAREAAAWVIEMAEALGVIRIRGLIR
jgi:hypothetical protein